MLNMSKYSEGLWPISADKLPNMSYQQHIRMVCLLQLLLLLVLALTGTVHMDR